VAIQQGEEYFGLLPAFKSCWIRMTEGVPLHLSAFSLGDVPTKFFISATLSDAIFKRIFSILITCFNALLVVHKGEGKAIRFQALTGPEDSRRLRLADFKTIGK
jgi:hypothetical protein